MDTAVTQGPIYIGSVINLFLYGVLISQVVSYFAAYRKAGASDGTMLKFFISFIFFLDSISTVFDLVYVYQVLVHDRGDLSRIGQVNWLAYACILIIRDPAFNAVVEASVQIFFARRVKSLIPSRWPVIVIGVLAIIHCLSGIATGIAGATIQALDQLMEAEGTVTTFLLSAVLCDLMIAFFLIWHLREYKTGIENTDSVLNDILWLIISTGLLTAIWATVNLILYLAIPDGSCLILYIPIAKLYSNSLMTSLNARRGFRARLAREPLREMERSAFLEFHQDIEITTMSKYVKPET